MKNKFLWKILVIGTLSIGTAQANVTYTTSTGAVFTQIQSGDGFGVAWKDPSGLLWSKNQGDFDNSDLYLSEKDGIVVDSFATRACAKIGGTLPTLEQYKELASYFSYHVGMLTDQGRADLYKLFPDMDQLAFWSSSVGPSMPGAGYCFDGLYGDMGFGDVDRGSVNAVRCVR